MDVLLNDRCPTHSQEAASGAISWYFSREQFDGNIEFQFFADRIEGPTYAGNPLVLHLG